MVLWYYIPVSVIPLPTCSAEKKVIFNLFYCLDQAEKKLELGYFEFLINEELG